MRKTEKKYWENGYSIRGGHFKQFAFSFLSLGVIIYWGKNQLCGINFYKLESNKL